MQLPTQPSHSSFTGRLGDHVCWGYRSQGEFEARAHEYLAEGRR